MQKNALTLTLVALVLSVFSAFLRWLQTRIVFEEGVNLAATAAPISIVYTVYSVLALVILAAIVLVWLRRYTAAQDAATALRCEAVPLHVLLWVLAAAFVCSALLILFSADQSRSPMLQRLLGAFAIFGGLSCPFLAVKRDGGTMGRTAAVVLSVFYLFWLLYAYKNNADNPCLWAYAPELLALAATTVGAYEATGYFYGRAKPSTALVAILFAAFLDISVLFDPRALAFTVLLGLSALLMLLLGYLLISNLKESGV